MASRVTQGTILVVICGSMIAMLSMGLRQDFGLFMAPVSADLGWGREVLSLAIAIQSLIWGVATPLCGFIADKYGPGRVAAVGGLLYTAGLVMMANATHPYEATLSIGFLTGAASACSSFPIVLSVIGRKVPRERRSFYLGVASAIGSSGQLILVPMGQWFITDWGWVAAMLGLATLAGFMVPLSASLAGGNKLAPDEQSTQTFKQAMKEAYRHRGFRLLSIGYFVCGGQALFLSAHLPAYLNDLGFQPWLAPLALSLIGGFNMFSSIVWGKLGNSFSKKYLLCFLYAGRSVVMLIFIMTPITQTSVILFACFMGLFWLGTVPLTSGIVAQVFGTQYMATLVGITFVSHQVGSFLGIWLGGVVYDLYGTYDPIFWGAIIIGFAASLVHYPIDERPLPRLRTATAVPAE